VVKAQPAALEIGKAEIVEEGSDVAIFGLGALLPMAKEMAVQLRRLGLSVAVINPRFVKPIDRECIERYGRSCGLLITFEDHVLSGGYGSAVLETLNAAEISTPVVRIGWPDQFIEHGKVDALREKYGISVSGAMQQADPYLHALLQSRLATH
jgi:1-deoxy-D-xylulose-5-phosphate synthase